MALFLRHHSQNKQDNSASLGHGVQVFLLKENPDGRIVILQCFHPFDTVQQVSGEAGYCFGDDQIDLSVHGILHQLLKALPVLCVCAGKAVVHIGAHIDPVLIGLDLLFILRDLQSNRNSLIQIIRGHPAVGRNPQGLGFISLGDRSRGCNLMDVRAIAAFDLFEYSPLFSLAFCLKAGPDGFALFRCPRLGCLLHIVHVPFLLSASPGICVSL